MKLSKAISYLEQFNQGVIIYRACSGPDAHWRMNGHRLVLGSELGRDFQITDQELKADDWVVRISSQDISD